MDNIGIDLKPEKIDTINFHTIRIMKRKKQTFTNLDLFEDMRVWRYALTIFPNKDTTPITTARGTKCARNHSSSGLLKVSLPQLPSTPTPPNTLIRYPLVARTDSTPSVDIALEWEGVVVIKLGVRSVARKHSEEVSSTTFKLRKGSKKFLNLPQFNKNIRY